LKNYETIIDDGASTSVAKKGDGMQRATMLAILQAYVDFRKERGEIGKTFVFFIDEAELHLHPSAQRKLKNALIDVSKSGDQVYINTHSSVLISDNEDNQRIFKVENNNKRTSFESIDEKEKGLIIYDLLGGSPSDLLLPKNFIIVEGRTDFIFLEKVIKRIYTDRFIPQIIFSEGDFETQERSFDAIGKLFAPLYLTGIYKDKLIILCDKPSAKRENNFKNSYPSLEKNNQLFVLNNCSLEEYYPDKWSVD
jgi:putative ATP-dependent endonuclease of OLD family